MIITQVNGMNIGGNVMEMAKTIMPKIVKLFINLLWANSPQHWIVNSTYFHNTLFVSVIIKSGDDEKSDKKIRRSFDLVVLNSRSNDIYGLASDCIDEMKTNVNK